MKSQDIYILLKLVCLQQEELDSFSFDSKLNVFYSARGLSNALGVSKTEVSASIRRSFNVGMAINDRKLSYPNANKKALLGIIVHGLKYAFPAKLAEIVRGVPTASSRNSGQMKITARK